MHRSDILSDNAYLDVLVEALSSRGVRFEAGLSETELEKVQELCAVRFPPDLAAFLRRAVPIENRYGGWFPNWRGRSQDLRPSFERPLEGILFDVKRNDFWAPSWGSRPTELRQALAKTKAVVNAAPKLIPVCSHRYIPSEPSLSGNPVLSVVQTDIIRYGDDLASYFHAEFGVPLPESHSLPPPRRIRFWDELLELNGEPDYGGTWRDLS